MRRTWRCILSLARAHDVAGTIGQVPLLRTASSQLAWWLLPASAGLFLVAEPAVRVIYETGAFGEEAVRRTAACAQALALGMLPLAWGRLLVRALHAGGRCGDAHCLSHCRDAGAAWPWIYFRANRFIRNWPRLGIASANVLMAVVAYGLLRRRGARGIIDWRRWLVMLLATVVMAVVVLVVAHFLSAAMNVLLRLCILVTSGGGAYVGVVSLLDCGARRQPMSAVSTSLIFVQCSR